MVDLHWQIELHNTVSQSEPAFETDYRPASLTSRLGNAFNQWVNPTPTAQAGQQVPHWELRDALYNRAQSKSILHGQVVAMVFAGTWCVPCQWEAPIWKAIHLKYAREDFKIVSIFLDHKESIPPFALAHKIQASYHCCPATEKIKWDFNVNPNGRVPCLALVDRNGVLNGTWMGYHSQSAYESAIKPLL